MKKTILIFFAILISSLLVMNASAKEPPKYPVDAISPEMLENAEAVVRNDVVVVEISSPSKVNIETNYAITILKESALSRSVLPLHYDKFSKVEISSVIIYDKDGNKVKKIKTDDIHDFSAVNDGSIYSDDRVIIADLEYQNYPFTVEYIYTYKYNSAFFIPDWSIYNGYNVSVENSSMKVTCLNGYEIRYQEKNVKTPVVKSDINGSKVFEWSESQFKAPKTEAFSISPFDLYPTVDIAPTSYELDGFVGDMSSWKNFGLFINQLLQGKDNLSPETASKMNELVKDCSTDKEKIQKIYQYSQEKNRYISIQVGVGGWQPFDAATVDRLSYGDCKALSNYTKTLLESVGIKAYYTLIEADEIPTKIDEQFSYNMFNHIVLCVPSESDTTWLECTNSFVPCGYMGSLTDNRYALLIKEDGGYLAKTKVHTSADNIVSTKGEVKLLNNGYALANYSSCMGGVLYERGLAYQLMDDKNRKEQLIKDCSIPSFNLVDYKLTDGRDQPDHKFIMNFDIEINNCFSKMGDKMFLVLNQYNPQKYIPAFSRKRVSDLYIVQDHVEFDTITYIMPEGIKVESLPDPVEMQNSYGEFKFSAVAENGQIKYVRYFAIKKGQHPANQYNEFREFLEKVAAADKAKCILTKDI